MALMIAVRSLLGVCKYLAHWTIRGQCSLSNSILSTLLLLNNQVKKKKSLKKFYMLLLISACGRRHRVPHRCTTPVKLPRFAGAHMHQIYSFAPVHAHQASPLHTDARLSSFIALHQCTCIKLHCFSLVLARQATHFYSSMLGEEAHS